MADFAYQDNKAIIAAQGNTVQEARNAQTGAMISRQAQEVQMAMYVAKIFPRDENLAFSRVMTACRRKSLAAQAQYEYPRGNKTVTGPSIRLAEVLARAWGNIDFGITELENVNGESQVMAYAWDLETNTRQTKIFSVKHERHTKKGSKELDDPRDVYELVANNGARRLRACILGIIPGDVVDAAIEECTKTLVSGNKEPLVDRVRKVIDQFTDKFSISKEMLEKYVGCNSSAWSERDVLRLGKVYISIRDGMAKREDYFDLTVAGDANKQEIGLNKNDSKPQPDPKPAETEKKQAEKAAPAAEPAKPKAKETESAPADDEEIPGMF